MPFKVAVVVPRALAAPVVAVGADAGLMVVGSLAVLLAGFASPPPETVAVLVTFGSSVGRNVHRQGDRRVGCAGGQSIGARAGEGAEVSGPTGAADRGGGEAGGQRIHDRDGAARSSRAGVRDDNGIGVASVALGEVAGVGSANGQVSRSRTVHDEAAGAGGGAAKGLNLDQAGGGAGGHCGGDLGGRINRIGGAGAVEGHVRGVNQVCPGDNDAALGPTVVGENPIRPGAGGV